MIALLLSPKAWAAIALAALLVFMGWQRIEISDAEKKTAEVRVDLADYKTTAAESAQLLTQSYRAEEGRRETSKQSEIDHEHIQTAAAQAATVVADAAAGQLRNQLTTYVAAVHRATTDSSPAGGSTSQRGADPLDLLAELYGGDDEAAGEIAQYAGRIGIAGATCERIADGLQGGG